ncbi:MAG TPA: PmoA family protein [bacterium]|nr:PmoA family protein [bacterium]
MFVPQRRIWHAALILIFPVTISFPVNISAKETLLRMSVRAGDHALIDRPVSVPIKDYRPGPEQGALRLEEISRGERRIVPCQVETADPPKLWWILDGITKPGTERVFELSRAPTEATSLVEISMDSTGLALGWADREALRYIYGTIPPPDPASDLYRRSGFIHPVRTPGGKVLTRIHPSDHIHHMGFWAPWTKTEFEGRAVDFWNLGEGEGTVRFTGFKHLQTGPVFGEFVAQHQYIDLTAPGEAKVALNEEWQVRLWKVGGPQDDFWLWEFVITQRCATQSPLIIKQYRYGGFGFRGTADWNAENSNYLTSLGKTREDGNGTRTRWCDVFGVTDKGMAGIVFLSHPENYTHPEPVRIWPQGDVFFGFCPVVNSDWTLKPGISYTRRYRIYVHDGEISQSRAELLWQNYAASPDIQVERMSK